MAWADTGKPHTREESMYGAIDCMALPLWNVCPCLPLPACAHGWLHTLSVDVLQELGSWLHVRRSAAGQPCDCSNLELHQCVYMPVDGLAQTLPLPFQVLFPHDLSLATCVLLLHVRSPKGLKTGEKCVVLTPALIEYIIKIYTERTVLGF